MVRLLTFAQSHYRALRGGRQPLAAVIYAINVATTHGLVFARVHDRRACNKCVSNRRPNIVDLELGRDDGDLEHTATGVGQRVVRQVTHDTAVHEAVLLPQLVSYRDAQLR